MLYQSPHGKVIHLSVEQYLDLTEEELEDIISQNYGDYVNSPWHGSSITGKKDKTTEELEPDTSLDFENEEDMQREFSKKDILYIEELGDLSEIDFTGIEE